VSGSLWFVIIHLEWRTAEQALLATIPWGATVRELCCLWLAKTPVGPEYSRSLRKIAMMETVDRRELENVAGFG
jgi:hypothetical protein